MAAHFQHECPHCGSKRASFTARSQHHRRDGVADNYLFAVCGVCDVPSLFWYVDFQRVSGRSPIALTGNSNVSFPASGFNIVMSWPESGGDTPENLPENVKRFYEQGVENEGSRNWDAAGSMFRKALDVATKILDPQSSSLTLFARINKLEADGKVTSDIAKWAHEVRIDGNDAVHGDDPETLEDVAAVHQFCRAFLTYTFSLPALVSSRASSRI